MTPNRTPESVASPLVPCLTPPLVQMSQHIVASGESLATVLTLAGNINVELGLHEPRVGFRPVSVLSLYMATHVLLMSFLVRTTWKWACVVP